MRISPTGRRFIYGSVVLLSLFLLSQPHLFAKPSFAIRPEPAWVKSIAANPDGGSRERPTSILLEDQETKLSANNVERFFRHCERVNTGAGLTRLSQLQFNFEPSYQSLEIHFIRIIRAGQTINALEAPAIKIIAKEDDLDEQIYNGTLAAVLFLKDIRVGDIVDYAYSVNGDNPVFGGRFSERLYLAGQEPIQNLRIRLLSPADRTLYFRNQGTDLASRSSSFKDEIEYLWEQTAVAAVESEDSTPPWFEPVPSVWVSEYPDWQAVVQWAAPLYQTDQPLPAELKTRAEAWATQFNTPEQKMIAALRFVQQEIRYLGIELGPYSHRPSPPSQTLSRRFGDCKDKSLLLCAVLRHMGIDCTIALVNTSAGRVLDNYQPSPDAFDHVIVQTQIGGRTFWLDPTIESQRGNVDAYYDPFYERALVLRSDARTLETIPEPKLQMPTTAVREHYLVDAAGGRVSLQVTSSYRGADADVFRYRWSQRSVEETGRFYLNYYAENNPSIRSDGPPIIHDNEQDDVLTVEEKYVIDSFWKDDAHYFSGELAYDELPKPNISQRSMPLALKHPTFLTQTIEIDLSTPDQMTPHSEVIANDAFRFEYSYQPSAGALRLSYSLQTFRDHVPPEKVGAYLAQADRIWNSTGVRLPMRGGAPVRRVNEPVDGDSIKAILVVVVAFLLVGGLIIMKIRRNRDRRPAFIEQPLPGTTPETAMRSGDKTDIETLTKGFKCRCGSQPFRTEALSHQETLFYDGERLGTLKLKCESCGRVSDVYFVQPSVPAEA